MSGTSMDGIDAALIRTNGKDTVELLAYLETPYSDETRTAIRQQLLCETRTEEVSALELVLTEQHISAVQALLQSQVGQSLLASSSSGAGANPSAGEPGQAAAAAAAAPGAAAAAAEASSAQAAQHVHIVGFHGHTLSHAPDRGHTLQIGDGQLMANTLQIPVAFDFRTADVLSGGQGAPLVPVFHRALVASLLQSDLAVGTPMLKDADCVAVVNVGGVSNITFIDLEHIHSENPTSEHLLAFDCGPGNAYMDDFCASHLGCRCDEGGCLAEQGTLHDAAVDAFMQHAFFTAPPPKSLDRQSLGAAAREAMALLPSDAPPSASLATLTSMTACSIAASVQHLPRVPPVWIVCGGGRHNAALMGMLQVELTATAGHGPMYAHGSAEQAPQVVPAEVVGWRGDSMEAEAFGFLAVRAGRGLPLTYPGTTGVPNSTKGGVIVQPESKIS